MVMSPSATSSHLATSATLPTPASGSQSPPSSPTSPSSISFNVVPDLDKTHRKAVAALAQARQEHEMGAERREGLRQRVKEINGESDEVKEDQESSS